MNIIKENLALILNKNKIFKISFALLFSGFPFVVGFLLFCYPPSELEVWYSNIAILFVAITAFIVFPYIISFVFFKRLTKNLKIQIFILLNFIFVRIVAYLLLSYFGARHIFYMGWIMTAIFFLIVLIELLSHRMKFIEWYFFVVTVIVSNTLLIWISFGSLYVGNLLGHSFP